MIIDSVSQRTINKAKALCEESNFLGNTDGLNWYAFDNLNYVQHYWAQLQDNAQISPFQKLIWMETANSVAATDRWQKPLIVIGFSGNTPTVIIPLKLVHSFLHQRCEWLFGDWNDYNGPIVGENLDSNFSMNNILCLISANYPEIDCFSLRRLRGDLGICRSEKHNKWSVEAEYSSYSTDISGDWSTRFEQIRSPKTRQRLKNKYNKLKKLGPVTFRRVRNEVERNIFCRQILTWKSEQLSARGNRNPFESFSSGDNNSSPLDGGLGHVICDVTRNHPKELQVYALYLNDIPIAGIIGFVHNKEFSLLVTAYNPEIGHNLSIGVLLLKKTLELFCRAGFNKYDFLIGDEAYKLEWSDQKIPLQHLVMGVSVRGHIYRKFFQLTRIIKKSVNRNSQLAKMAQLLIKVIVVSKSKDKGMILSRINRDAVGMINNFYQSTN